jgi:hypothetical protein
MKERIKFMLLAWLVTAVTGALAMLTPIVWLSEMLGTIPMITGVGAGILTFIVFAEVLAAAIARVDPSHRPAAVELEPAPGDQPLAPPPPRRAA